MSHLIDRILLCQPERMLFLKEAHGSGLHSALTDGCFIDKQEWGIALRTVRGTLDRATEQHTSFSGAS